MKLKRIELSPKGKRKRIESILICIFLLMVICSVVVDFCGLRLPVLLLNTVNDFEGLFFSLFSAQASMAALSIAIVSILNGTESRTFYSIPVSRYITELRPCFLTHKLLVTLNIVITVFNYFFVSKSMFNISIALFCTSMGINIVLTRDTYALFSGMHLVKSEIKEYVLTNYSVGYLDELDKEISRTITDLDSQNFRDDCEILLNIYQKEIEKNKTCVEITTHILQIFEEKYEQAIYAHNLTLIKGMTERFFEFVKVSRVHNQINFATRLWYGIQSFYFKGLMEIPIQVLYESKICIRIHSELSEIEDKDLQKDLQLYSPRVLYSISHSRVSSFSQDIDNLNHQIYYQLYWDVIGNAYGSSGTKSQNIMVARIGELCQLHKYLIDTGNTSLISQKFIFKAYYEIGHNHHDLVLVITLMYLYYLACREKLLDGKNLQDIARKFLIANGNTIKGIFRKLKIKDIIEQYREEIFSFGARWEYMENGQAKCMVMDSVIQDFLIFSLLKNDYINITNTISFVIKDSYFSIYSRYFSQQNSTEYIKSLYTDYSKYFNRERINDDSGLVRDIMVLKSAIEQNYKSEYLAEVEEDQFKHSEVEKWKCLLTDKVKDTILARFNRLTKVKFEKPFSSFIKNNISVFSVITPPPLDDQMLNDVKEYTKLNLAGLFVNKLSKNMVYQKLPYERNDKQTSLLKSIRELDIKPDISIGQYDCFWDEEDPELIKDYTREMQVLEFEGGYPIFGLLDSSKIYCQFSNLRVEFFDLTRDEIMQHCTDSIADEKGQFFYNVTNNIYLPFTEKELMDVSKKYWKKIEVKVDLELRCACEKVGSVIEVSFDN